MKLLITCGPGSEPIDEVRRITNFSTGRLGIFLSNFFTQSGHDVTCLASSHRTCRDEILTRAVHEFITIENIDQKMQILSKQNQFDAVLHAAALGDFIVDKIIDAQNNVLKTGKISSALSSLHLILKPAPKLIFKLRKYFPKAKIVGWKYEIEGSQEDALKKAFRQISQNQTDACILNGKVTREKFIFCGKDNFQVELNDLLSLASYLNDWLTTA